MDSYFSLTTVAAAAISFYALFGSIFFNRKSSKSNQENKTNTSSLTLLAPPSSSSPPNCLHHVFPSFHGTDVRTNFLSHIIKELRSKGIDVFIDNDIERSKSIGPELVDAIRGSRIAIVLLSKNYTSSTWCLNELVEIIKCREELGQAVMSLFYQVDPTDVKKQTGDFGKVFKKTCKGKTEDEIRRWKRALTEVAQIAGFHSSSGKNEAEMIEDIATDVSNKLNLSAPCSDFDGLVGMDSKMTKMRSLLQLDSDEVRIVGILGPSGIGKTTIARSLFNRHSQDFQLSVFIDNIKRNYAIPACSDDYSVKLNLQKHFMSQLTNETDIKNFSHLGVVKDRLKDKKVLVVLDDVDRSVQLEAMAKETSWFGPGSRIIITTQDRKVLKASGIKHIHKVKLPSNDEALQMFCMYAFDQKYPKDGFQELAWKVRDLVGKLPLGLKVMGSYFRGMSEQDWTEALPRLRTHLDRNREILSILKFSYDALHDEDKSLFLHIACFFNGEPVGIVEGCLAKCFLDVTQGIRVLVEKSLISIEEERIEMSKLLVQLGRQIVQNEFASEPGKRRFLNDASDIGEVLNDDDNAGYSSVIGINLDEGDEITWTSERAFERLSNLQFLRIFGKCVSPQSMNYLSHKLRVLIWRNFKMTCFPSSFNPKFLVKLDMHSSKLVKFWEGIKPLNNLKWMDLRDSRKLEELPDLSTATNLHDLNLSDCERLVELPSSIGNAVNLHQLNFHNCMSLLRLPSSIGNAVNLRELNLEYCSRLVELPSSIWNIVNLELLNLAYCSSLVELPSSKDRSDLLQSYYESSTELELPDLSTAANLYALSLRYCGGLVKLPYSIRNATNLQNLDLSECSSLVELPSFIGNAINLKELDLRYCSSLVELPSSMRNLGRLSKLELKGCSKLEVPFNIEKVIDSIYINLGHCSTMVELPSSIENAINLQELNLNDCSSPVEIPFSIGNAFYLQSLNMSYCSRLVKLPSSIGNIVNFEEQDLDHCSGLVELSSPVSNLGRLSELKLKECSKLEVLLASINLETLGEVTLSDWSLLKSYPESSTDVQEIDPWVERISGLRELVQSGMEKLESLPQLPDSLWELDADNGEPLERLGISFSNPDINLSFLNYFKLNQEEKDHIIQTQTSDYEVFPGGEVPTCFTYQSSGSSLTVKLNQTPLGTSTKFKACIVCGGEDEMGFREWERASVSCSITSGGIVLSSCLKIIEQFLPGNLYTFEFEVETEELTSTELVFDFHGADVRTKFLSHVLKELRSKGIDSFIDNDIERSKLIGPELLEAIRGSRIAIVLLSQNYTSSTWCLNELVEIMKCREEFGQTVMPLFYEVDPTDIKKQTGDFGKVFKETCKGKTKEEIRRWKHALTEVAQIAGFHSAKGDNEAEMIEDIATDVSNKLNLSASSNDFDGLVGMEARLAEMRPVLQLDSDEVRKIGILGPPGIGKTTIARSLFNRHSQDFQLCVFMDNIKRKYVIMACSDDYSVKLDLQKQFMSQLTNETGIKIPHLGVAKDRLKDKKVLVVLDDVDQLVQLEAMAKETSWFGPGSRIIITTQDENVLKASGINHIHRVNLPSDDEALQIFCMYAFGHKYPKDGFKKLACEVRSLVGGLPLGLRVMGSYFRGMSEQDWREALPRLKIHLDRNGEIANILKFSYDALNDEDKELFLHIACFFSGEPVDMVERCLEKCFEDVRQGLRVLSEKSLIYRKSGLIMMSTLLFQLGRQIVRKESVSEPGKRQFLNDAIDIGEVLSDDKADSRSVIGINVNEKITSWTSERAFERLSNLQFLRIQSYHTDLRSMDYVSRKLKLLIWPMFPLSCFPSSFNPKFLVKLEMESSELKKLWEGTQPLSNLKWMDLSSSDCLKELPNLSTGTNLQALNLSYCSRLEELPDLSTATNLQKLELKYCSSLVELPYSIGNAVNLRELDLSNCSSLVKLPFSIGNAINLCKMNLSYCSSLVEIPSSIGNAVKLRELDLSYCSSLVELPLSIGNAVNLKELNLSHCSNLVELPSSMRNLGILSELKLKECTKLEVVLTNINLESLKELNLSGCSLLKIYPESSTDIQELDPWLWRKSRLQFLALRGMKKLVSLLPLPDSLLELDAEDCESLERLDFSFCNPNIRLNFLNCFKLNQEARDLIIRTPTNQYAAFPAGEVPICFTYRSYGSSVTVKLNQNPPVGTATKFKACFICAVEDEEDFQNSESVFCSITSGGNAVTAFFKILHRFLPGHLYTFNVEVETEDVTSTELVFEFNLGYSDTNVTIKECGILQLLEVPLMSFRDGYEDYEPLGIEI
ncbi:hypothetical protein Bca4012_054609 [Brassica carinata]